MNESLEGITKNILPVLLKLDQVECPVIHRFGPGIYIREVKIPAGAFAIGHYQRFSHLNIFLKGKMTAFNDDGTKTELEAPMIFVGKPGRKCGIIHEDVVWLNVYATNETDVETLENMFLDKGDYWDTFRRMQKVEAKIKAEEDREDFLNVLNEYGFTPEQVDSQTRDESDQVDMPMGSYKMVISDSPISGKGVFATADIEPGEVIGPARIGPMRTPIGRYTNHSKNPNAEMSEWNNNIYLIAKSDIKGCRGGILGNEITTDYRKNLELIGVRKCLG